MFGDCNTSRQQALGVMTKKQWIWSEYTHNYDQLYHNVIWFSENQNSYRWCYKLIHIAKWLHIVVNLGFFFKILNELDTKWHDFSREIQIFFLLVDMKNEAALIHSDKNMATLHFHLVLFNLGWRYIP